MKGLTGMIIPDGTNPFFSRLSLQMQRQLANMGYPMIVLNTDCSRENELKAIDVLRGLDVRGYFFVSSGDNEEAYNRLKDTRIPVVILDREIPETDCCDFVITDNRKGVFDAVTYLKKMGHSKIGIIKGTQNTDPGRVRYSSFLQALTINNLNHDPRLDFEGEFDYWSGLRAAEAIYNLPMSEMPSAVFCSNDLMAFGLLQSLIRHGIDVPNQISIVGVDDIPLCTWVNPRITTIRQETTQAAISAVELLVSRIEGSYKGDPRLRVIEPTLIKRESVKIWRD